VFLVVLLSPQGTQGEETQGAQRGSKYDQNLRNSRRFFIAKQQAFTQKSSSTEKILKKSSKKIVHSSKGDFTQF